MTKAVLETTFFPLLRDINQLRSILPPDFSATAFTPDAAKHEIRWMTESIRMMKSTKRPGTCGNPASWLTIKIINLIIVFV